MKEYTLTNQAWMGLGIYVGRKPSYRRAEMESYGVDYSSVVSELTKVGIIVKGKIVKEAKDVFMARFNCLPSQTHQYCEKLGFTNSSF